MRVHEHEHDHDGSSRPPKEADAQAQVELPHLVRAATAGRSDVVGGAGMGTLQRAVGNHAVSAMLQRERSEEPAAETPRSSVHDVVSSGGGDALDTDTRSDMEARLGADFSDVRLHTGSAAHESAAEVGARAYTVGNNVVFQRDAYDPASHEGRTTLAHELTHVIQQRQGPVDGTESAGGIRVSDPSDRFEREASANADRVMSQPGPAPTPAVEAASVSAPDRSAPVQREVDDAGAADAHGSTVQREAEEENKEEEAPSGD